MEYTEEFKLRLIFENSLQIALGFELFQFEIMSQCKLRNNVNFPYS